MATSFWISRAIYAAARLRLADRLAKGPKNAEELAPAIEMHAQSLHRLLRSLASLGLFTEQEGRRFALTPLGEALVSGAAGSARSTIMALAGQSCWSSWGEFLYSIETGKSAFEKLHDMSNGESSRRQSDECSCFGEAIMGLRGEEPGAVLQAYDFSRAQQIVDIGGGTGNLLATILEAHPQARGTLLEQPHVVPRAVAHLKARRLGGRCVAVIGDFFQSIPSGGDIYLLSHVLHNWPDDKCLLILHNCRRAIKKNGKLLLIEMVLPSGDEPHLGKLLDLAMLAICGGTERTQEEYSDLLSKAGFRISQVVSTASATSIIEAE